MLEANLRLPVAPLRQHILATHQAPLSTRLHLL